MSLMRIPFQKKINFLVVSIMLKYEKYVPHTY